MSGCSALDALLTTFELNSANGFAEVAHSSQQCAAGTAELSICNQIRSISRCFAEKVDFFNSLETSNTANVKFAH
jgi:hypothetical protein